MTLRNERGATLIVVSITLLVLLGFAALAVDAGLGYNERRGTTNAADNAALAAAWEECNPTGMGPEAAALSTAAENGYVHNGSETAVVAQPLDAGEWEVTISQVSDGAFGPATPFAAASLEVVSQAVAICDPTEFSEGMAIFAGGESCSTKELDLTGGSITVDGAIHSNGDLQIHATPDTEDLSGPITYSDTGTHGTLHKGPALDYPIDVDISEYTDGTRSVTYSTNEVIDNEWLEDNEHINPDTGLLEDSGVYYTSYSHNGKAAIELKDLSAAQGVTVTFVSQGFIRLIGGTFEGLRGHDPVLLNPDDPDQAVRMLFFSDFPGPPPGACNDNAIQLSANTSLLGAEGVLFAPNAGIQVSNSTADLDGSIIGFNVKSSGSELSVSYDDDPNFIPDYRVELLR